MQLFDRLMRAICYTFNIAVESLGVLNPFGNHDLMG